MGDVFGLLGRARVSKRGAARLANGHVWIYASDVERRPGDEPGLVAVERAGPELIAMLDELLAPRAIVLKDDGGARAKEGLARHVTVAKGAPPVRAAYHEGEVKLEVDLVADQKTGSFLDQSQNHVLAGSWASG